MSPFMQLNDSDAHDRRVRFHDLALLKHLWPYVRPHRRRALLSLVILPGVALTQIVQPMLLKATIDGPIRHHDMTGLFQAVAVFLGVLLIHYALRYTQMLLAQSLGQRIIRSLRCALYDHLQSLSPRFFQETPLGRLVTRISADVENISEMFASGAIALFSDVAVIVGILVAMGGMNLSLAVLIYALLPVVGITMAFFQRRSRALYNTMRVQLARMNSHLQESLGGMTVIQLLRQETRHAQTFADLSRDYRQTNVRSVVYDSAFTAAVELLSYTAILLILAAIMAQQQHALPMGITLGTLVAFLHYIQMLFDPIEELSDKFTVIQSGLASMEKVMELMAVPPDIASPSGAVRLSPETPIREGLCLDRVVFGYHPDQPVLKGVSLTLHPGETIALVGATGAGKSSLIKLLNRQYDPWSGRTTLDGVPLEAYDLGDLRRRVGMMAQDGFLFSRTVAQNITMSYPDPPDPARLARILRQVHLESLIRRLPQGLETLLSERGSNISAGEQQLLLFARALWHDADILILDEATSAIDPHTESLIQAALQTVLADRTAIIIAHRLSTIQAVDRVYTLQDGVLVSGSPAKCKEI